MRLKYWLLIIGVVTLADQSALADPATAWFTWAADGIMTPRGPPAQPNFGGAPPTIPQALNPYSATPLGQPGVMEAAVNTGNCLTNPLCGVPLNKVNWSGSQPNK
jgi:hypothetical protein